MLDKYLPKEISEALEKFDYIQEIRLRIHHKISILDKTGNYTLQTMVTRALIERVFAALCNHSVYALKEEIQNGFITIPGGHRAGICGRCVVENGRISHIADITSINIRVAREVKDCALAVFENIRQMPDNLVVISPPNCGKTTFLRDLARLFSNHGSKVSIADERGEIAPVLKGAQPFDLGENTDVLQFCPKIQGMMMLLRTMNPDIIVTDEIGSEADGLAIAEIMKSGVHILTSFHGYDVKDFKMRFKEWSAFKYAVILNRRKEVAAWISLR